MTKITGSGSGSISQRHGSADLDPDPHQNVMDPQHCFLAWSDPDSGFINSDSGSMDLLTTIREDQASKTIRIPEAFGLVGSGF
jgi:hypothetical protein